MSIVKIKISCHVIKLIIHFKRVLFGSIVLGITMSLASLRKDADLTTENNIEKENTEIN
jgi:hypothetical protein